MDKVLTDLNQEHEIFLFGLAVLERSLQSGPAEESPGHDFFLALELFLTYLEKYHHGKEEGILFPILDEEKISDAGGVTCSTYFTPRILEGPFLNSFKALEMQISGVSLGQSEHHEFRQRMLEKKSMLMVPIEDHVLGAKAAKWLMGMQSESRESLRFPFFKYSTFLKSHIEREENCLFPQCEKSMNAQARTKYLTEVEAWNKRLSLAKHLEELLSAFKKLQD